MSNLRSHTQERIIEAAVQLFSRQGFNGAGTREIARLADINEATLFRHFARKRDLFWAAVQSRISRLKLGKELESGLAANRDPQAMLPMIFEFLVHSVLYQPELTRLLNFSVLEFDPALHRSYRKQLGSIFESIRAYLAKCVERGAIRRVDPLITTLGFVGSVVARYSFYELLTGADTRHSTADETVTEYCDFWLEALMPVMPAHSVRPAQEQPAQERPA
jgi:AcrR family transcriptional regulator